MNKIYITTLMILTTLLLNACTGQPKGPTTEPDQASDKPANEISFAERINELRSEHKDKPLRSFSFKSGRCDSDIQTIQTYEYDLPVYIVSEVIGWDASSGCDIYKIDDTQVFSLCGSDIVEEYAVNAYCDKDKLYFLTFAGGHSNCLNLDNELALEEFEIFKNSFTIANEKAFENIDEDID